jgi:hypothetical protein
MAASFGASPPMNDAFDLSGDHLPPRWDARTSGDRFGDYDFILNVLRGTGDPQRLPLHSVKRLSPNMATANLENSELCVHDDSLAIQEEIGAMTNRDRVCAFLFGRPTAG